MSTERLDTPKTIELEAEHLYQLLITLEQAHAEFIHQEPAAAFSAIWLREHGYARLLQDAKAIGGIHALFAIAPDSIYEDTTDKERQVFIEAQAQRIIELNFHRCKLQAADTAEPFSEEWFKKNDYFSFYLWAKQYGGIQSFITRAAPAVKEAFIKAEQIYTIQDAQQSVRRLFEQWKENPLAREFDRLFLLRHDPKLYQWITEHYDIDQFFATFPDREIVQRFQKHRLSKKAQLEEKSHDEEPVLTPIEEAQLRYGEQSAVQDFSRAHTQWKTEAQETPRLFTRRWLLRNQYFDLVEYMTTHSTGVKGFLEHVPPEVAGDFRVYEGRTVELEEALKELIAAYAQWKKEDPAVRRTFDYVWLTEHADYRNLHTWATKHFGGFDELMKHAPEEVQQDYTKRETKRRTQQTAFEELDQEYEQWLLEQPDTRGEFTSTYIRKRSGNGLYLWALREHGGFNQLMHDWKAMRALREARKAEEQKEQQQATIEKQFRNLLEQRPEVFAQIINKFKKIIGEKLVRYLGAIDSEEVDDILQDVWMKMLTPDGFISHELPPHRAKYIDTTQSSEEETFLRFITYKLDVQTAIFARKRRDQLKREVSGKKVATALRDYQDPSAHLQPELRKAIQEFIQSLSPAEKRFFNAIVEMDSQAQTTQEWKELVDSINLMRQEGVRPRESISVDNRNAVYKEKERKGDKLREKAKEYLPYQEEKNNG